MKSLNKVVFVILLVSNWNTVFSQEIDAKCKKIYSNYIEKDSLLKITLKVNDSLEKLNNKLSEEVIHLKAQITGFEREAKLINIGKQKWDTDNLKVVTLRDGTPIFYAATRVEWDSLYKIGEPAYCFHKYDSTGSYGYLYNYYAIESGKLAPVGMRIPSKKDVEEMIQFLENENTKSAMLLKSMDTNSYVLPRWKSTGSDKFEMNFKPCGFRLDDSKEWYFANKVYYWCQNSEPKKVEMMVITEINDDPFILEKTLEEKNSNYGLYVRCIKQ
jgi:uncharacterized protein (TIGR02145 family)